MNSRISRVVTESGLTKTAFGKKIGLSQSMVSMLCNGSAKPSDRTLADISREFNVPLKWLKDGEGPMRLPEPEEDLGYINRLLADDDAETVRFIKNFLRGYNALTPADQKVIDNLIRTLTNQK